MEVILLEKVENLGKIGDLVKVKSGYGRNYLLPKGKATLATGTNIAAFEARRAELELKQADEFGSAQARAKLLEKLELKLVAKAGPEGKLFGSLGTVDIAEAAAAAGVELLRSEVRLPNGPVRSLGDHEIEVHLHTDVNVTFKINVQADGDTTDPLEVTETPDATDATDAGEPTDGE